VTPLRQVAHLLRRDLRRNRLFVLVLALAVGGTVGLEFLAPMHSFMPRFLAGLGLHVIWAAFAAQVVQADPLRGRRAQWRALPLSGWALFSSKCILVGAGWLAVVFAARAPWIVGIEVVWTDLAMPMLAALPWLILVVVLALMTPNLKVFATLYVFCALGILVVHSVNQGTYSETTEVIPAELSEPATATLASEHHLRFEGHRVGIRSPRDKVAMAEVHLRLAPPSDSIAYLLVHLEVERYLPAGDTVRGRRTDGVWPIGAPSLPVGEPARPAGPEGIPPDSVMILVPLDGPVDLMGSIPEPGSSGLLRARVEGIRPTQVVTLSLTDTEVRTPRRRWQMLGATVGADGPEVTLRLIEAPGTELPIDPIPWSRGEARRGATHWVLHNRLRGEAVLLVDQLRVSVGEAGKGSIRTLALTPSRHDFGAMGGLTGGFDPPLAIDREWLDGAELHLFEWTSLGVQEFGLPF
jgi:hypothetical protein